MLITFVYTITLATSEQLEYLIEMNILTVIHFHVLMSLLKMTMSVSKETEATVEEIP